MPPASNDDDDERENRGKGEDPMPYSAMRSDEYDRLLSLALDPTPEARAKAARVIGEVYAERGAKLTAEEIAITGDILHELIREIELPVRKTLSEQLAHSPQAPRELVVFLANDSIEAAYPVLCRSAVLDQQDLIEVARLRTMQHRMAIAAREDVGEALADALVSPDAPRHEPDVLRALLDNPNARISKATMSYLAELARTTEPLRAPVLSRRELTADHAKRLYWLVSAALRRRILESYPIDPLELDEQLQATVDALVATDHDGAGDPAAKAVAVADELKASQALSPTLVVQTLRQGHVQLFEAMLAALLGLKLEIAQRVIYGEGGEALAVACRSLEIEKPAFASIFLLTRRARGKGGAIGPTEMARAMAVFDDMSVEQAGRLVRRWRIDSGFVSAQLDIAHTTHKVVH